MPNMVMIKVLIFVADRKPLNNLKSEIKTKDI